MRRKIPTGQLAPASPAVRNTPLLLVDYDNAEDFLADLGDTTGSREVVVLTERALAPDTPVQLGLCFPGLVEPIVLDAIARSSSDRGEASQLHLELLASSTPHLSTMVERIRANDRRVVQPVVCVLIVEDNLHVCELVKTGLTAATRREMRGLAFGFEIALDGGAALEILRHQRFDAAIVDIYLPVLAGDELIRQIRAIPRLASMPIIAMSGGGDVTRTAAMRAGASTYLDKPIRLRKFVDALRQTVATPTS
jgi:CheY-like chemotaxis protein